MSTTSQPTAASFFYAIDGDGTQTAPLIPISAKEGFSSQVQFTRPADTTAYTAGDVLGSSTGSGGAVLTFANIAPANGGHIRILNAFLRIDLAAIISGMTTWRLYLYSATIPSVLGDNAAYDLATADRSTFLGYIDFTALVDFGSTLFIQITGINLKVKATSGSLFGYLSTVGVFTPSASFVTTVNLETERV